MKWSDMLTRYNALAIWMRIVIAIVAIVAICFIGYRFYDGLKVMIFGNTEAKKEHANTIVAQQQGQAAKEIGQVAQNQIVKTYEHDVEIDRTVKEGQDAVTRADRGQQMDPEIDNAVAAGLCRVHDSLCRGPQH